MAKDPAPFDQGLFLMHLHKGKEYFDQNQLQKAREELEAAHHLRPQDEKVLNMLGMAYFKLEMLPQAEEMYVTLASNNPDVYTLQSNLGLIRLKLEKLSQAEESLTRALELQPNNPKAHLYLGLLFEKMGNWEPALHHFEQAKADKMIQKVKEKIEEEKNRADTLLAFEVLEVIAEQEEVAQEQMQPAPQEPVLAGSSAPAQEGLTVAEKGNFAAQSEWEEGASSTEKLRRKDVLEAMERLHSREEPESEVEEEELVEDTTPEVPAVVEEGIFEEEEAEPEKSSWEKTQPTIVQPEEIPDPVAETISEPVTPSISGFIAEDTAADISTYLAESREEDEPVEDEFIQAPPAVTESTVVRTEVLEEIVEEDNNAVRIPTPEEVENETNHEALFEQGQSVEEEAHEVNVPEQSLVAPSPITPEVPEEPQPVSVPEPRAVEVEPPPVISHLEEKTEAIKFPPPAAEAEAEPAPAPVPAFVSTPVSAPAHTPSEHASFSLADSTIPIQPAIEEVQSVKMGEAAQAANLDQFSRDRFYIQPLIGADRFLLIDPHLLEIIISETMVCRKGTISSFTGNLKFQPSKEQTMPLMEVSGSGILFLADRRKEIFLISLNNETIFVEANHLLVAQSALHVESISFHEKESSFSMVKVSGRGTIALTCQTKPLTLKVYDSMPANIPADALIAWSGRLQADINHDQQLKQMMMAPDDDSILLRFSGSGDVVVEQGSLWGDRRMQK
ncbi:MAG: hypothetical protein C5B54_04205 [Acidobacteria bacterium]|nr:MAG: hypothetical protein C5B54_04205 [Acidobacteriota bacterium]